MTSEKEKEIPISTTRGDALTGPVEDYLKAIYALGRVSDAVATNDIAQRLMIEWRFR